MSQLTGVNLNEPFSQYILSQLSDMWANFPAKCYPKVHSNKILPKKWANYAAEPINRWADYPIFTVFGIKIEIIWTMHAVKLKPNKGTDRGD